MPDYWHASLHLIFGNSDKMKSDDIERAKKRNI